MGKHASYAKAGESCFFCRIGVLSKKDDGEIYCPRCDKGKQETNIKFTELELNTIIYMCKDAIEATKEYEKNQLVIDFIGHCNLVQMKAKAMRSRIEGAKGGRT
jgi:hypothetical protein